MQEKACTGTHAYLDLLAALPACYCDMDVGPLRAASAAAFSASTLATSSSTSVSPKNLSPAQDTICGVSCKGHNGVIHPSGVLPWHCWLMAGSLLCTL